MPPRACNWVFTLNNPTADDEAAIEQLFEREQVRYCVYGRELAPTTGTLHLQGFIRFIGRRQFNHVRDLLPRSHIEVARGSAAQAAAYCKKDGDYVEFGDNTDNRGRRTDIEQFVEWLKNFDGWSNRS